MNDIKELLKKHGYLHVSEYLEHGRLESLQQDLIDHTGLSLNIEARSLGTSSGYTAGFTMVSYGGVQADTVRQAVIYLWIDTFVGKE